MKMNYQKFIKRPVFRWIVAAKLIIKVITILILTQGNLHGQHVVSSPDARLQISLEVSDSVRLGTIYLQQKVSSLAAFISTAGRELTKTRKTGKPVFSTINDTLRPVVPGSRSRIPDVFNELDLKLNNLVGIQIRVYDDGWGYRFYTLQNEDQIIDKEGFNLTLQPGDSIWFPEETSYLSHSERLYPHLAINQIGVGRFCSLPALIHSNGIYTAVTEADVAHFPGLYLRGTSGDALKTSHPPYPIEEKAVNDRTVVVAKGAPYIAKVAGKRTFPWRVFGVTDNPGDLVGSDLVYRFGPPLQLKDTDWIKPGKVAWDWWNDNNITGVAFRSGINTNTYKYYIDFAADFGLEYIILDEGWSNPSDLFDIHEEMNMEELFSYARNKKVGIILWVLFNTLDKQLDSALNQFEKWGAAGIKVDFMQRDDQKMVEYYWKIAQKAAGHRLLVDFHGSYKPDGLRRAYPNVLTREGVKGLENNKWGNEITPSHDLILPFTRMFAGPMDYTPGAMINATQKAFHPVWSKPMSQGTRCHQLAMYVIYESPLQMLADNPTHYRNEPLVMQLLKDVPVTWDETRVLAANPGQKLVLARRKNDSWYFAGFTDWTPREVSFRLPASDGDWIAEMWTDGPNAVKNAVDFTFKTEEMKPLSELRLKMAPGGGFVVKLTKKR